MMTDHDKNSPADPHLDRAMQDLMSEVAREDIPPRLRELALRLQEALARAREADHR